MLFFTYKAHDFLLGSDRKVSAELISIAHCLVKCNQGSHRLENYLNIQNCLEKSLKIRFALKST